MKECIEFGDVKILDVMPWEWKDDKTVEIYDIPNEDKKVCGIIRHKSREKFSEKTQFQTLNEIAFKSNLFNKDLLDKSEKLRTDRNKVHLAGLSKTDDYYEKKDIQVAFESAKLIIEAIEGRLDKVRK